MDDTEFNEYFAALDKAGDRSRSVLYAFIAINMALLMYSINVFTYPAQQYIFDDANLQMRCEGRPDDKGCEPVREALERLAEAPPLEKAARLQFLNHQLTLFYDRSVALRTFKAPLLGLETDLDLLWLIFPLIGMVAYFIMLSALVPTITLFRFLLEHNKQNPKRLRLMQSTLVISGLLNDFPGGEITHFYRYLWLITGTIVFAIPVIVIILMMLNQTNVIPALMAWIHDKPCGSNCTPLHKIWTAAFSCKFGFEAVVLIVQAQLFAKLVGLGIRFGHYQGEADGLLSAL